MAGFSSRGPVVGVTLIRPDLSGPGVNVTSAWPPNDYVSESGTSMATPHVAGAVALGVVGGTLIERPSRPGR